ncbi:hypothetical protein NDU88_002480 [Pleurodeles waltl]|uniref:Uncharacterized protein n=1 Tax=Pleurodeles waltl TaxID=8319 RepID=A0AAV7W0S4_PLEWA|nr:hypothetical protein NDU88_002480 [Pleurodeles waltl]
MSVHVPRPQAHSALRIRRCCGTPRAPPSGSPSDHGQGGPQAAGSAPWARRTGLAPGSHPQSPPFSAFRPRLVPRELFVSPETPSTIGRELKWIDVAKIGRVMWLIAMMKCNPLMYGGFVPIALTFVASQGLYLTKCNLVSQVDLKYSAKCQFCIPRNYR